MSRDTTISRRVLSDQVKDRLLQAILEGSYPPGSRIVETRAAREFGTSQAPVREALRDLEALGVVEITAFRGARVRRPKVGELIEALEIRSVLESLAVRLALPRLLPADFEELGQLLEAMHRTADEGDPRLGAEIDASFHGLLIEIAGNGTLERVWESLGPLARTHITFFVAPGADLHHIADLHAPILAALRAGDEDRAVEAIRHHFEDTEAMLRRHWRDDPVATAGPASTSGTTDGKRRRAARSRRIQPTEGSVAAADGLRQPT